MAADDDLAVLGFVDEGPSRRGGRTWTLPFNRYLTFTVHDHGAELVLTWVFLLGDFFLDRGMQVGAGETTFQELYPRSDVRLPRDVESLAAEIRRTLGLLRVDLGDPAL